MKNVSGKAGELVVVISPEAWESAPGTKLNELLAQAQVGLPQEEPLFSLIDVPKEAFGEIFKTTRNLVLTDIGPGVAEPGISFKKDVYAYTQAVLSVSAKNEQQFIELLTENAEKIVGFFLKAERDRLKINYANYREKAVIKSTEERFGVTINVPPGFRVEEDKDDFMWIRFETPDISQGIFIYSYPYTNDSTFTADYLIAKRNIALKHNVPGPTEGSYMTTEDELPVLFNTLKLNGNYAVELRGLWKVANDFMGGPFVSISVLDLLQNRVVTIDGYVYAPGTSKRNLIRQVEAMIYSMEFTNQADIDKINKQFE